MMNNSKIFDQYYTNPEYAKYFLEQIQNKIDLTQFDTLLEPSAGSGAFYHQFPSWIEKIGIDIDPKIDNLIKMDFLQFNIQNKKVITIGNPPFGKNATLAIKFFNHAAQFSQYICFIIPKTFRKNNIINRLNPQFHLIWDEDVPDNSFIFENEIYNVNCCAQIWQLKEQKREKNIILNKGLIEDWFEFTTFDKGDFEIQRVGNSAGRILDKIIHNTGSFYYIKSKNPETLNIFKQIDFNTCKYQTSGYPSIGKIEIISLFLEQIQKYF
jgi:hypothetical protein